MKKGLTLGLTTSFVLGLAASAFAIHGEIPAETSVVSGSNAKVTIDGSVRVRGFIKSTDVAETGQAGYDTRVRVGVKAQMSDATKGYIQLENGVGSKDFTGWGHDGSSLNTGGSKTGGELNILQSWINYEPGMFGLKVGHMPLSLGNKLFFDHTGSGDDAIVAYLNPSSDTHIGVLAIKLIEGGIDSGADLDAYVALLTQKIGTMKLGVNITNLYNSNDEMNMYNLGVDLTGKFGPATVKADVQYQTGDIDVTTTAKGYAATVEASMAAGPVNVGLLVATASGDDGTDATEEGQFVNFLTDTRYQSTMVGYILANPTAVNPVTGATKNSGIANMLLVSANITGKGTCPITQKPISLKARINWMKANEVAPGADDDLGLEYEAFATWKLDNGLSYKIELAYLMSGDAFGVDPENAYFMRHNFTLKF